MEESEERVRAALCSLLSELARERVAQRGANYGAKLGDACRGGGAEEVVQLAEGPEAAHGEGGRHRQRQLRLVVCILVVLGERFVEEGSALLRGMRLDAERVAYGENLVARVTRCEAC